jgi:SAM-dependent methyltransferase
VLSKNTPAPTPFKWTPDFWQSWRETDNPYRHFKSQHDRQIALTLLSPRPGERILEVGCGYGWISRALWYEAKIEWVGIDRSETMLRQLRRDGDLAHSDFALLADATRLPFPNGYFDKVLCTGVLMHIADDDAALAEMVRVLRPNGRLLCSFNNALSPFSFAARIWNLRKPGFVQKFRLPGAILRRLAGLGMQMESVAGDGVFTSVSLASDRFSVPPRFLFSTLRAWDRRVMIHWPTLAYEIWYSAIRKPPECAS